MKSPNRAYGKDPKGSAPPPRLEEPRFLVVGRVLRPHGVRGELRIRILTDYPERLAQIQTLYLGTEARPYELKGIRFHQGAALVTLAGCDDRNAAEEMRGQLVHIPVEAAVPLEEGEYYHFQLIGVDVVTDQSESLGRVAEVLDTGANDVYVVHGPQGQILLPAIESVVTELDLSARRMVVTIPPGLLDE